MLLCTIFYKYASLVQLPDIRDRMSLEQRDDFAIAGLVLTIIFIVCVFGALGVSVGLLIVQLAKDRRLRLAMRAEAVVRGEIRMALDELQNLLLDHVHMHKSPHRLRRSRQIRTKERSSLLEWLELPRQVYERRFDSTVSYTFTRVLLLYWHEYTRSTGYLRAPAPSRAPSAPTTTTTATTKPRAGSVV